MTQASEKNILSTICYSDIFDYPLTREEIDHYLICEVILPKGDLSLDKSLDALLKKKKIIVKDGYYCLKGREKVVDLRRQKEKVSKEKLIIAEKAIKFLSFIPTVRLIGLSGSVAMENAGKKDDIDIFIITQNYTIWLTRMICLFILELLGLRRPKNVPYASNKLCLNMLIDERTLLLPKNKQNLFTAHEIVQMKPIFVRDNIYDKFLKSNGWIKKYLPNSLFDSSSTCWRTQNDKVRSLYLPFEQAAKYFQIWYMNSNKTTEIITDTLIAFHPKDNTNRVISDYYSRLKRYTI